ncbi:MAG: hypothetical protein AAFO15_00580 [Pseudomonadota bacterium]
MNSEFFLPYAIQFKDDTILNNDASLVQILCIEYADKTYLTLQQQREILNDLLSEVCSNNITVWLYTTFHLQKNSMFATQSMKEEYLNNKFYIAFVIDIPELGWNGEWNNILTSMRYNLLKSNVTDKLDENFKVLNNVTTIIQEQLQEYFDVYKLSNDQLNKKNNGKLNNRQNHDNQLSIEDAKIINFVDFYLLLCIGKTSKDLGIENKPQPLSQSFDKFFKHEVFEDYIHVKCNDCMQYVKIISLHSMFLISDDDILKIYNVADAKLLISQVLVKNDDDKKYIEKEVIDASQDELLLQTNKYDNIIQCQNTFVVYGDALLDVQQRVIRIGEVLSSIGLSFVVEDNFLEKVYFSILPGNTSFLLRLESQDLIAAAAFFVFLNKNILFPKVDVQVTLKIFGNRNNNINLKLQNQNYLLASVNDDYNLGMIYMLFNHYKDICIFSYGWNSNIKTEIFNTNTVYQISIFHDIDLIKRLLLFVLEIDKKISLDITEDSQISMQELDAFCAKLFYCGISRDNFNIDDITVEKRKEFILSLTSDNNIIMDLIRLLQDNLYILKTFSLLSVKYEKHSVVSIAYMMILIDILPKGYILCIDGFVRLFYKHGDLFKNVLLIAKKKDIVLFCCVNVSYFDVDDKHALELIINHFNNLLVMNSLESNILLDYNFGFSAEQKAGFLNMSESLIVSNKDMMNNINFSITSWYADILEWMKNNSHTDIKVVDNSKFKSNKFKDDKR